MSYKKSIIISAIIFLIWIIGFLMKESHDFDIKAIIGLGNPGPKYYYNRHNIGFQIVDKLAERFGGVWEVKQKMEITTININGKNVFLLKPQTFMNLSGEVIPFLQKKGIKAEHILVVHDELEFPFGKIKIREGGSARGHNGLRSIIQFCGKDFVRLRFGIGRPSIKAMVGDYVLQNFSEPPEDVERLIDEAADLIQDLFVA